MAEKTQSKRLLFFSKSVSGYYEFHLYTYTVEEIIGAAGFIPFVDIGDAYLPNNLCSFFRHIVDMGIKV